MASATADVTAAGAAGAGSASAGASGASSGAASSGAAGGAGGDTGAVLTDDAILGITPEGATDTSTGDVGASGAAASGTGAAAGAAAPTQAVPAELTIEDFKALFQTNPKVQSLWDKYNSGNEVLGRFGTVAQAREAAASLEAIGGIAELAKVVENVSNFDSLRSTFFGGNAEGRKAMVNDWYDDGGAANFAANSKAVGENFDAILGVMKQRDAARYNDHFDRTTREGLEAIRYGDFVAALAQARQSGEGIEKAVDDLLGHAKHYGLMKQSGRGESPEARVISQRKAELDARDAKFANDQAQATVNAADAEIGKQVVADIDAALSALKVNGRPVFGEKSQQIRGRLAQDVRKELDAMLSTNPLFVSQFMGMKARGVAGKEKELIDLTMRHAKLLLPKAIEKVMNPWTNSVVSQAAGAADKLKQGASRTEVSGGTSSGGTRTVQLTSDELKKRGGYDKVSDDDILNA